MVLLSKLQLVSVSVSVSLFVSVSVSSLGLATVSVPMKVSMTAFICSHACTIYFIFILFYKLRHDFTNNTEHWI